MCAQCSVSCGQGKTTRQVLCVNFSDQIVDVVECDADDRPATEQECAMSQCSALRSSDSRPFPSPSGGVRNNLPTAADGRSGGRTQAHQWRTGPWGAVNFLLTIYNHLAVLGFLTLN